VYFLVFFLPGYAITLAFFPNDTPGHVIQAFLSLGLSLVITIMGGLVLNLFPEGLTARTWEMWFASIGLFFGVIALLRVMAIRPAAEPAQVQVLPPFATPTDWKQIGLFLIALIVVVITILQARTSELKNLGPGFTQLWVTPSDDPTHQQIKIGIRNFEGQPVTYRVEVIRDDQQVYQTGAITLAHQEQFVIPVAMVMDDREVVVLLYRLDQPEFVYRSVFLNKSKP
jgi:uncharacterized membrane protein